MTYRVMDAGGGKLYPHLKKAIDQALFRFGTTLTSTFNSMRRGFDDLTFTFYETKLYDHDKDNWWQ